MYRYPAPGDIPACPDAEHPKQRWQLKDPRQGARRETTEEHRSARALHLVTEQGVGYRFREG